MKELTIKYLDDLPYEVVEDVNQLRVNLSFSGQNVQAIMLSSSVPDEGKSFLSLCLWKSLAEIGKRVVFVDADLRMSLIRSVYEIQTNDRFTGLAHVLSGQNRINDCLYKTNIPNAFMIPATNDISNPSNLLESSAFDDLLKTCRNAFDYIIIDTPPLTSVADALTIGKYCDGSILVVRAGYTKKSLAEESSNRLKNIGKPFLGFVLNRVDVSRRSSSYYYYKKGNYYYGASRKEVEANKNL